MGFFKKTPSKTEEKKPSDDENQRRSPRRRTRLHLAKLFSVKNEPLAECMIFDISDTGARLRLETKIMVPMKLKIYDAVLDETRLANVKWRYELEIGIRYASGPLSPEELKLIEEDESEAPEISEAGMPEGNESETREASEQTEPESNETGKSE